MHALVCMHGTLARAQNHGCKHRLHQQPAWLALVYLWQVAPLACRAWPLACPMHSGAARQVKVYQHSPDGVVTIKFRSPEAAQSCIRLMSGRFFGGRRLEAALWDGATVFYAPKPVETAAEQAARLEAFARELEEGKAAQQALPAG